MNDLYLARIHGNESLTFRSRKKVVSNNFSNDDSNANGKIKINAYALKWKDS